MNKMGAASNVYIPSANWKEEGEIAEMVQQANIRRKKVAKKIKKKQAEEKRRANEQQEKINKEKKEEEIRRAKEDEEIAKAKKKRECYIKISKWREQAEIQKGERDRKNKAQKAIIQKNKDVIDSVMQNSGIDISTKDLKNISSVKRLNMDYEEAYRIWRTRRDESNDCCLFCNNYCDKVLEVAHIWDQSECEESLRDDYNTNIIILCRNCHVLYDIGEIYIDKECKLRDNKYGTVEIVESLYNTYLPWLTEENMHLNWLKKESLMKKGKLTREEFEA